MMIDNQAKGDPARLEGIIKGSLEQWRTGIPLGRLADPDDQAAAASFLISDAARHITGQAICVDGGQTFFLKLWNAPSDLAPIAANASRSYLVPSNCGPDQNVTA